MNNLYVFAIGGSGERVMRSFIMLLAAGVELGASRVIPIFVDNDAKSKALKRCQRLISYYNAIPQNGDKMGIGSVCQQYGANERASFFQTEIADPILLDVAGDTIGNLKTIIGNSLSTENSVQRDILEERDLLFSEDDLNMNLTVGFVGNPNIGSVVLNALSFTDPKFSDVLAGAGAGDGVMVIGSLFGGTGAAGFPLIVNNFMRADENRPTVGGVAILPYFEFGTEDEYRNGEKIIDTTKWDVNSDTFDTKTRAALMYYDDYMKGMDFLYYVGDDHRSVYPHYVGGEKQDNPVHLVELLSAMSIVDFSKQSNQERIVYKEPKWGVSNDTGGNPTICNASSIRSKEVKKALIKFQLMREFFINKGDGFLSHGIHNKLPYAKDLDFTEDKRQACAGGDSSKIYKDINAMSNEVEKETGNFPYAWGLNAFFKEWVAWWADLGGKDARRTFAFFPNAAQDIDQNNITQKFFAEGNNGVAATQMMREGPFYKRRIVERMVYPNIATNIQHAHDRLNWANIPEERKLAALLKTVSDGLDVTMNESCNL